MSFCMCVKSALWPWRNSVPTLHSRFKFHSIYICVVLKLFRGSTHDDGAWRATVCRKDRTAPETRASLILITRHEDGAWQTTLICADATTPDTKVIMSTSTTCHDYTAWQRTYCWQEETTPNATEKLQRNRSTLNVSTKAEKMNAKTELMPTADNTTTFEFLCPLRART